MPTLDSGRDDNKPIKIEIPTQEGLKYLIVLSNRVPLFSYYTRGNEIFRRLVLKVAYTDIETIKNQMKEIPFLNTPKRRSRENNQTMDDSSYQSQSFD